MAEISLQDINLGYNKLSKIHLEAQLITASGLALLRYSWSYLLVFILLTDLIELFSVCKVGFYSQPNSWTLCTIKKIICSIKG